MADIDFITDLRGTFQISLTDNPQSVTGNRALLNRFEITFLTKRRKYFSDGQTITDPYGGDAVKFISIPRIINDNQGISAAVSAAVDQTVESMKSDEPSNIPDTEKLDKAELSEINVIDDQVFVKIRVYPVEAEVYDPLVFNLPITQR